MLITEVGSHAPRWFPDQPHNLRRQVLTRNLVTTLARESESALSEADQLWVLASAHGVPGLLSKLPFSTQRPIPRIIHRREWVGIQDHGLRIFEAVHRNNIED